MYTLGYRYIPRNTFKSIIYDVTVFFVENKISRKFLHVKYLRKSLIFKICIKSYLKLFRVIILTFWPLWHTKVWFCRYLILFRLESLELKCEVCQDCDYRTAFPYKIAHRQYIQSSICQFCLIVASHLLRAPNSLLCQMYDLIFLNLK